MAARSRSDSAPTNAAILLIDDNSLGLAARKVLLEELGHCVTTVAAPRQGMQFLSTRRFDIVITDFKMPEMSGTDLIRWMHEQNIDTPVILISGFADTLGLCEGNTGADVVIQKNAHEINHLLRAVRALLRRPPQRKPPSPQGSGGPQSNAASS